MPRATNLPAWKLQDAKAHFSAVVRDAQRDHAMIQALGVTAERAGGQIMVASAATAAGFLAFVPTAFVGVAELGLIAGGGMLIAFAVTLLFLPACLVLFNPRAAIIGCRFCTLVLYALVYFSPSSLPYIYST